MSNKLIKTRHHYYGIILTSICCMTSFNSGAQEPLSLGSCSLIQDSDERLRCYDQAMSVNQNLPVLRLPRSDANTSTSSDDQFTPSPATNTDNARSTITNGDAFGMELKAERSDSEDIRQYTVVAARHNDFTGWTIEFDNGSTWHQVGTDSFNIVVNDSYTIRRATLNSFLLSGTKNNRKIRVTRLN